MTTRTHIRVWDEEMGCHMPTHADIPEAVQGKDGRWRVDGPGWALELTGDITADQAERICRRAAEATLGVGYRVVAEADDSAS